MEPMGTWRSQELEVIGNTVEIRIGPVDADGAPRASTPIWIVRHGDDLYIRSYRGAEGPWYRAARRSRRARIRAAGIEHDVILTPHISDRAVIDDAYRTKYGRSIYVDAMVTDATAATTLKLTRHR
jgi:hypothetical protein